ncbi:hypothetical protein BHT95_16225 [Bacillus paralicheniformis]|nr:hypothetical protein BHT95_16225 [Bacillus paralicheniformis]
MPRSFTERDDGGVLDRMSGNWPPFLLFPDSCSAGSATAAVDCKVASKTTKSQNSKLFQDFVRQSEKTMPGMVF